MRLAVCLALAFSLAVAGCSRAQDDPAFGAKVRAYLLSHPEVLEETLAKLSEKKAADARLKAVGAVRENRQALERDPRDFVANPKGTVTVTEFYDYRCPHCINAAPQVLAMIRANPDVRFVFKELPIFGDASDRAARAMVAVHKAGGDYVAIHRDLMAAKPLDDAAIDRVLKQYGFDPKMADAGPVRTEAEKQLGDIQALAVKLGIEGTPAFIIGDTLVPGEDMDAVNAAIKAERGKVAK
ncbi:MAG: DsbA family protein [Caulobacteraceae bacterium]